MSAVNKEERIEIRVSSEVKDMLKLAAELNNQSLSNYIINNAVEQAKLDLAKHEKIVLDDEERDNLLNALANPAEPTEALKDLFR